MMRLFPMFHNSHKLSIQPSFICKQVRDSPTTGLRLGHRLKCLKVSNTSNELTRQRKRCNNWKWSALDRLLMKIQTCIVAHRIQQQLIIIIYRAGEREIRRVASRVITAHYQSLIRGLTLAISTTLERRVSSLTSSSLWEKIVSALVKLQVLQL